MSLSYKEPTTKKNFEAMLKRDFGNNLVSRKHGPTTLYYAPVHSVIAKSFPEEVERHIASWESGTGWIFKSSAVLEIKAISKQLLEDLKLFMRGNHVDVTSINTHTTKHMVDNPELCFEIEMFEPNDVQNPEVKTRMWAYPANCTIWVEQPSISVHDWPGMKTAIYQELRSHGFVDSKMNDWKVEIC